MSDDLKTKGMGSVPHAGGVAFRVWAPHALRTSVIGSFNDWDGTRHPTRAEENGNWFVDVAGARVGDQYRYLLSTPTGEFKRIDPYAPEVTGSVGNAVVHDPNFDWQGDVFRLAPWNELVIYELHATAFNDQEDATRPGQFPSVSACLGPPVETRRQRDPGHADRRVRGGPVVGLQPRPHLHGREHLRRPGGVHAVRPARPP